MAWSGTRVALFVESRRLRHGGGRRSVNAGRSKIRRRAVQKLTVQVFCNRELDTIGPAQPIIRVVRAAGIFALSGRLDTTSLRPPGIACQHAGMSLA